jgi:hypothetical protein
VAISRSGLLSARSDPLSKQRWIRCANCGEVAPLRGGTIDEPLCSLCTRPKRRLLAPLPNLRPTGKDPQMWRRMDASFAAVVTSLGPRSRVWDKARKAVLTDQEYASVLGRRPYDLGQHACVSTASLQVFPSRAG